MKKTAPSNMLGAVVIGVLLVVMIMQGDRLWNMIERLVQIETKVEIYHDSQ